ncbi:hypothetical protein IE81DRAFT_75758 [Ceraceosorus guamensis]|uniref:Uncharacterized protein n=1 Tax=Ceraceosorus guamensis TaxID=1522189 RepID=A0A316W0Z3_9BASI|nr:hypothetical protein IE81DRAFT_75758 [Ceraceosorus guamensis]PWN43470.1 hypothetical protein IE81DRAFT_75758 [Ceraceosorus guamensis]
MGTLQHRSALCGCMRISDERRIDAMSNFAAFAEDTPRTWGRADARQIHPATTWLQAARRRTRSAEDALRDTFAHALVLADLGGASARCASTAGTSEMPATGTASKSANLSRCCFRKQTGHAERAKAGFRCRQARTAKWVPDYGTSLGMQLGIEDCGGSQVILDLLFTRTSNSTCSHPRITLACAWQLRLNCPFASHFNPWPLRCCSFSDA